MKWTIEKIPENIRMTLQKTTEEKVFIDRLNGYRGAVIKIGDDLFTSSKKPSDLHHALGSHLCSSCKMEINSHLCPKVQDLSMESCRRNTSTEVEALKDSKRLEKYDFITLGVEGYGMKNDFLVVCECERYKRAIWTPTRERIEFHE